MVQRTSRIVEPEQQRADQRARTVLVPAKARHHAVRAARVLDLDHRSLAGLIRGALVLGDDAVEPGAFEPNEPFLGEAPLATAGGEMEASRRPRERLFERGAPLGLGARAEIVTAVGEHVEGDEGRRCLGGELPDARGRRVEAQLQRVEVEPSLGRR